MSRRNHTLPVWLCSSDTRKDGDARLQTQLHSHGAKTELSNASRAPEVDPIKYGSMVGSLRYLLHTRSDLSFAVGYVSRFMEKPTKDHMTDVKTF